MGQEYYFNITSTEWMVLAGIFLTSGAYWVILDWWYKADPAGYDENTWLMVVVGVGYVLLWMTLIVPQEIWLKFFFGFISASVLIITRSLKINIQRNRRFREHYRVDGDNQDGKPD